MDEEREQERPRPRVVDKRVSAGGGGSRSAPDPATIPPAEPAPAAPQPAAEESPSPATQQPLNDPQGGMPGDATGPGDEVWTPEQEAQAQQMAQEIAQTPSIEWVVNTAVSLANIAATKLDFGAAPDARLAIDALSGILKEVGPQLQDAEAPLKQTLAQLQMAYASRLAPPTSPPSS